MTRGVLFRALGLALLAGVMSFILGVKGFALAIVAVVAFPLGLLAELAYQQEKKGMNGGPEIDE